MRTIKLGMTIVVIIIVSAIAGVIQAQETSVDFSTPENTVGSFMEKVHITKLYAEKFFSSEVWEPERETYINTAIKAMKKIREEIGEKMPNLSGPQVTQLISRSFEYKKELTEEGCYIWLAIAGKKYEKFKFTLKREGEEWKIISMKREIQISGKGDWQYPIDSDNVVYWKRFGEMNVSIRNYSLRDSPILRLEDVYACGDGVVRLVSGSSIIMEHFLSDRRKVCSVYERLDEGILVEEGQIVKKGQKIASTSNLSFGIRYGPFPGKRPPRDPITDQGYWAEKSSKSPNTVDNWWLDPVKFIERQPKLISLDPTKELPFRTVYVPDDHVTIQAAVNAASINNTIIVRKGTYTESVRVNKEALTIKSENAAEKTIVRAFKIEADYVKIDGFTVMGTNKSGYGIYLDHSNYAFIANNVVSNHEQGIFLEKSTANTLTSNTVLDNQYGICLQNSTNNALTGNNMIDNQWSLKIWGESDTISDTIFENNIDKSNLINGKPIYYIRNVSNAVYSSDEIGSLHLINCGNITVEDLNDIDSIILINCDNITVKNLKAIDHIELYRTNTSRIENVYFSHNVTNGVDFFPSIFLASSKGNVLANNTINKAGIYFTDSHYNILISNTIQDSIYGIGFHRSGNNILTKNTLLNVESGIDFRYSTNNIVYLNDFSDRNNYSYETNIWNSPKKITYTYNSETHTDYLGNYWGNHTKVDQNNDGISDIPYTGTEESIKDSYPLTRPFKAYSITSPKEVSLPQSFVIENWKIVVDSYEFLEKRKLRFTFLIENQGEKTERISIYRSVLLIDNLGNGYVADMFVEKDLAPHESEKVHVSFSGIDENLGTVVLFIGYMNKKGIIGPIKVR